MVKLLVFLVGLSVLVGVALNYVRPGTFSVSANPSEAKRTLDNVRDKAAQFEKDSRDRAEDIRKKMESP